MGRRIVISVSVVDSSDDRDPPTSFTRAFMSECRPLDASDEYDQMQAAQRLADGMVYELFRRMIAGEPCAPPEPKGEPAAETGNAVGANSARVVAATRAFEEEHRRRLAEFLRARAAELKGKTLYHPEQTLEAWARDLTASKTFGERALDWLDDQIMKDALAPAPPAVCLMMLTVPDGEFLGFAHCDKCGFDKRRD